VVVQYRRSAHMAELIGPLTAPDAAGCPADEPQELYQALHAMLAQVIAEGQRRGEIRQGDPLVLAALCLELLSPRAFHNLARVVSGGPEDVADAIVAFVLHGLAS
jgi:hypothetical protein